MSWYTDALDYANKMANGEWKEGEQKEVEKVLSFIGGMHDKSVLTFEEEYGDKYEN